MLAICIITYETPIHVFLLQLKAIRQNCKEEYEIIIIDNSYTPKSQESISHQCRITPDLKYHKCKASSQNGSDSHAFAANLSYQLLKTKYNRFLYLDHDCIPIKPFSIELMLGDKQMGGVGQGEKATYFWPGCFAFINTAIEQTMLSFSPSHELGLDTGGGLHTLIEYYGQDRCKFFDEVYAQNPNFTKVPLYNAYALINDGMFMHFINGSNWAASEGQDERINSLVNIAEKYLEDAK